MQVKQSVVNTQTQVDKNPSNSNKVDLDSKEFEKILKNIEEETNKEAKNVTTPGSTTSSFKTEEDKITDEISKLDDVLYLQTLASVQSLEVAQIRVSENVNTSIPVQLNKTNNEEIIIEVDNVKSENIWLFNDLDSLDLKLTNVEQKMLSNEEKFSQIQGNLIKEELLPPEETVIKEYKANDDTNSLAKALTDDQLQGVVNVKSSKGDIGTNNTLKEKHNIANLDIKNNENKENIKLLGVEEKKPILVEDIEISREYTEKENIKTKNNNKEEVFGAKNTNKKEVLNISQQRIENPNLKSEIITKNNPVNNTEKIQTNIDEFIRTATNGDTTTATIKLSPESLGDVNLDLKYENGKLSINISVESSEVKELINSKIADLTNSLQRKDVEIEKLNIQITPKTSDNRLDMSQNGSFKEHQDRRNWQRQRKYITNHNKIENKIVNIAKTEGLNILA